MTMYININEIIDTKTIMSALATTSDANINVVYSTGDTATYDCRVMSRQEIAERVYENIVEQQKIMSEMFADMNEPTDETIEAMYQQYIAEQEARYDAEEAVLHHWL